VGQPGPGVDDLLADVAEGTHLDAGEAQLAAELVAAGPDGGGGQAEGGGHLLVGGHEVAVLDRFGVGVEEPSLRLAQVQAAAVGGDLTGTVANAQIAAGSVGTTELADGAVTAAKTGADVVNTTTEQQVDGIKHTLDHWYIGSGRPWVDPRNKQGTPYGAVGDGVSRPLSGLYGTLGAAQADFPQATALTDELDAVAFLRAMSISDQVRVGDGHFIINRSLAKITGGNVPGLKLHGAGPRDTILENRVAGAALIDCDGSDIASQYQDATELVGFDITNATNPVDSDGIRLCGQWSPTIDGVRIDNLTGNGIVLANYFADEDSITGLLMRYVHILRCDKWGVYVDNPVGPGGIENGVGIAINGCTLEECQITQNTLGGARLMGIQWKVRGGSISINNVVGLLYQDIAGATGSNNQALSVIQAEFDSNEGYNISLESTKGATVEDCKFSHGSVVAGLAANSPPIAIGVGKDGVANAAAAVTIRRPIIRVNNGTPTVVDIGTNANDTYVENLIEFTPASTTKVTDRGIRTQVRLSNVDYLSQRGVVSHSVTTTPATITPRLLPQGQDNATPGGSVHRITMGAGSSALTVASPIHTGNASTIGEGQQLTLVILNSSGGAITTTFATNDLGFKTAGFVAPANGFSRSALFVFELASRRWRQVGAWSPDIAV